MWPLPVAALILHRDRRPPRSTQLLRSPSPCILRTAFICVTLWLLVVVLPSAPSTASAQTGGTPELETVLALKRDGRFEEAIAALETLLAADGSNSDALTALAECQEAIGEWGDAAESWRLVASAVYGTDGYPAALFRRGVALQQTGAYGPAAVLYRAFLREQPHSSARDEVLPRLAECYAGQAQWPKAAEGYRRALDASQDRAKRIDLVLRLADALIFSGDRDAALSLLAQEAERVPASDNARYQYRWALAERAAGQEQAGVQRLRMVLQQYPQAEVAYAALTALLQAGEEVDAYQRGLVAYHAKAYAVAVTAFQEHVAADPEGHLGGAHYYAGLSYRALRQYDHAVREFDLLIDTHPSHTDIPRAWLAKGETLEQAGEPEAARQAYESLASQHPEHELAPEGLLRAARTYEQADHYAEAIARYAQIYRGRPDAPQAHVAAGRAGMLSARASDWEDAAQHFLAARDLCGGCERASAYGLWLARAFAAQGRQDEARELLEQVIGSGPRDYYSYRAWLLLRGIDASIEPPASSLLLELADSDREEAEKWLQEQSNPEWQPGSTPNALAQDGLYARARELLALGLRQPAVEAVIDLSRAHARDAVVQYYLAVWLRDEGLYRPSIQCAANIIYTTSRPEKTVPRYIWSLAYPVYYSHLVVAEAATNGLDPLLFLSLVRQESLFDPVIGSWAGAQGLAQVMPATGEWIASQLGDADYSKEHLLRPYVSIRYGVWYLAQQFQYLGGHPLAAMAAYNAGPGNSLSWLNTSGPDPDVFYETIAFEETRRYLDTVLPNYYHYRRLYASQAN